MIDSQNKIIIKKFSIPMYKLKIVNSNDVIYLSNRSFDAKKYKQLHDYVQVFEIR